MRTWPPTEYTTCTISLNTVAHVMTFQNKPLYRKWSNSDPIRAIFSSVRQWAKICPVHQIPLKYDKNYDLQVEHKTTRRRDKHR